MLAASTPKSVVQRQWGNHQSVAIAWAQLIRRHVVHQGQQRVGVKEGLVYSPIKLDRRDEPSINKLGSVLCVAQDRKVICKHDYSGDSRGLVFIMNHRHHQHQIRL
jgi:hypothetical protein